MDFCKIIAVGIIQAITEFLPISSSGHLTIFQHFVSFKDGFFIDVFYNTATLVSVLFFFRSHLKDFLNKLPFLLISTLPLVVLTLLFPSSIKSIFSHTSLLSLSFLITSIFLFATKFSAPKNNHITFSKALTIGLVQAIAILPGVSRSAMTITTALLLGLSAQNAFIYSFYLYIPVSLGALVLSLTDFTNPYPLNLSHFVSFIVCVIVGVFSLKFINRILIKKSFWKFGFYTLFLAIFTFLVIH